MDAERLMMSKIPHLSPNNMLKYVGEEMEEMSHKFQEYLVATKTKLSLDLEIKLLYGSWTSLSQGVQLKYPNQFQQAIDTFGHFFAQLPKTEQDFGTKRLYWTYPRHSTCTVVGNFESGSKQIFVTLGQAIVLLLFNDYSTLRFDEIAEKSGISADNLKLLLLPIARSGMLVKDTTTNFISEGDVFSFGNDFSSLRSEFDFSKGAKPSVTAQVNESSKIRIQAAIVRIMKHRQTMTWRKLVAEVYAMLAPSTLIRTRDINSAIPSLIEREFICHSSTDRNKLEYVA
jgi:cullin-4